MVYLIDTLEMSIVCRLYFDSAVWLTEKIRMIAVIICKRSSGNMRNKTVYFAQLMKKLKNSVEHCVSKTMQIEKVASVFCATL